MKNTANIRILKTSPKGAMLITDEVKTAWIMPKMRRADGTFTDGVAKALKESTTKFESYETSAKIEIPFISIEKETEKAVNVKLKIEGVGVNYQKTIDSWFPKSLIIINGNKIIVNSKLAKDKLKEIREKHAVYQINRFTEYDKSYGIDVITDLIDIEKDVRGKIFVPKSMSQISGGKLIAPAWMVNEKLNEKNSEINYNASKNTYISSGYEFVDFQFETKKQPKPKQKNTSRTGAPRRRELKRGTKSVKKQVAATTKQRALALLKLGKGKMLMIS